jgi:hypothetical protein
MCHQSDAAWYSASLLASHHNMPDNMPKSSYNSPKRCTRNYLEQGPFARTHCATPATAAFGPALPLKRRQPGIPARVPIFACMPSLYVRVCMFCLCMYVCVLRMYVCCIRAFHAHTHTHTHTFTHTAVVYMYVCMYVGRYV